MSQPLDRKRRFRQSLWRGCRVAFLAGVGCSICIGGGFSLYRGSLPPVSLVEGLVYVPLAGVYATVLGLPVIALVSWWRSGRPPG